jgi:3'-5' exoribonuclease
MSIKKIFDYQIDEKLELFVLIKSANVRIAKNGKKFIAFVLADASGEISAKFWDATDDEIARFQPGKVALIKGKREVYQGNPQIKLFHVRLAAEDEPQDPRLFVKRAPLKAEQMADEINQVVFAITNPDWNRIVRFLLKKFQKQFFTYPAAKKNHHAFAGGLAYHSLSMLRLAQAVAKQYPIINAPLLYAGVILHDMGKTLELSGAVATSYTVTGNLIGHIVLIDEQIVLACHELKIDENKENVVLLRHLILSHHGLLEYGSPVRPHLLEAEVLHQIDQLDASIRMLSGVLEHTAPGEFSEKIFGMDGRNFYRPEIADFSTKN